MGQQKTVTLPLPPVPGGFDVSKVKPAASANHNDIIVTAEREPSPYRLPLPNERNAPDGATRCPNGQRETTELLQADILRAGRGLRGCHPAPSNEGEVTFGTTRIRRPGRRAGANGQGTPAVSGILHF